MRNGSLMCLGLALAVGLAVGCSDGPLTGPTDIPINFNKEQLQTFQGQECEVIYFDGFSHGAPITSVSLYGGAATLTVSAFRNSPSGAVDATAYDTELGLATLNSTHNDTQKEGLCTDCDGIMAVVPDVDFALSGDDTQGGAITFTGFSSAYTWTIPSYLAVDDDGTETISLEIDGSQVGASSGLGNGSVELVEPTVKPITVDAKFIVSRSGGIDNIQVCRAPKLGRMTGGGGFLGMTGSNGEDVKVTHGFTVHCDVELTNNLEINWPGYRWHIEKEYFEPGYPMCTDDPDINPEPPPAPFDTFEGRTNGKLNGIDGAPIWFILKDAGEPGGKNDMGMIQIWDVGADPASEAPILNVPLDWLDHGNLQAHYDQPHGSKPNK